MTSSFTRRMDVVQQLRRWKDICESLIWPHGNIFLLSSTSSILFVHGLSGGSVPPVNSVEIHSLSHYCIKDSCHSSVLGQPSHVAQFMLQTWFFKTPLDSRGKQLQPDSQTWLQLSSLASPRQANKGLIRLAFLALEPALPELTGMLFVAMFLPFPFQPLRTTQTQQWQHGWIGSARRHRRRSRTVRPTAAQLNIIPFPVSGTVAPQLQWRCSSSKAILRFRAEGFRRYSFLHHDLNIVCAQESCSEAWGSMI